MAEKNYHRGRRGPTESAETCRPWDKGEKDIRSCVTRKTGPSTYAQGKRVGVTTGDREEHGLKPVARVEPFGLDS